MPPRSCPRCRSRSSALVRRRDGVWICAVCGQTQWRRPPRRNTGLAWGALALAALGAAALPLAMPWLRRQDLPLAIAVPLAVVLPPAPAGLEGIGKEMLLHALAQADETWTPRAEWQPDGRVVYHYKRRSGDPPLSLLEIRRLMADPPRFERERESLRGLLQVLRLAAVRIQIAPPRRLEAAAEWDPSARTIRIRPNVMAKGSAEFALVLNHEAIHVAQSCSRGHVRAMPAPLGLPDALSPHLESVLTETLYSSAGALEIQLEREAYANQDQLELGAELVRAHCRLASE